MSDYLLYGGLIVAGVSVIAFVIVFIALMISKSRLNAKLDKEYGKKQ